MTPFRVRRVYLDIPQDIQLVWAEPNQAPTMLPSEESPDSPMTPSELGGDGLVLAVLATLATLVKHERRIGQWLLKSWPRRKRKAIPARLQKPVLP